MLPDPSPDLIRPVRSDDFLPPIRLWIWLGGLVMLSTCGVAVLMAAVIRYNVTVKATAIARPSGEIRLVQAPVEGTIQSIAVRQNQTVSQGDVIALIDRSPIQTRKSQLQDKIARAEEQRQRLDDQITALEAQIAAESSRFNRGVAAAEAELARNQREYQDRQAVTQTELQEAEANLKLARDERDRFKAAAEAGIVSQLQYAEKEQALRVAEARVARAEAVLNPSNATVAIAAERIAQERAQGAATLASLERERKTLLQRRVELTSQISQDQKDQQQIERDLQKNVLRAPVSGTVLQLGLRNRDQVVRSGETIAQIAPSSPALVIKALVSAQDIGRVAVGQRAQIRISAYPYPDYGVLEGTVSTIAPDATSSQARSASPNSALPQTSPTIATGNFYEVTIQPTTTHFRRVDKTASDRLYSLQSGMEGSVDIISREETLLQFTLRRMRLLTDW
jgi:HlyD family type I secretion membrane fusion protein